MGRTAGAGERDLPGDRIESCFVVEALEVSADRVHIFLSFPPQYGVARAVGMRKSISANVIIQEHPEVNRYLWVRCPACRRGNPLHNRNEGLTGIPAVGYILLTTYLARGEKQ